MPSSNLFDTAFVEQFWQLSAYEDMLTEKRSYGLKRGDLVRQLSGWHYFEDYPLDRDAIFEGSEDKRERLANKFRQAMTIHQGPDNALKPGKDLKRYDDAQMRTEFFPTYVIPDVGPEGSKKDLASRLKDFVGSHEPELTDAGVIFMESLEREIGLYRRLRARMDELRGTDPGQLATFARSCLRALLPAWIVCDTVEWLNSAVWIDGGYELLEGMCDALRASGRFLESSIRDFDKQTAMSLENAANALGGLPDSNAPSVAEIAEAYLSRMEEGMDGSAWVYSYLDVLDERIGGYKLPYELSSLVMAEWNFIVCPIFGTAYAEPIQDTTDTYIQQAHMRSLDALAALFPGAEGAGSSQDISVGCGSVALCHVPNGQLGAAAAPANRQQLVQTYALPDDPPKDEVTVWLIGRGGEMLGDIAAAEEAGRYISTRCDHDSLRHLYVYLGKDGRLYAEDWESTHGTAIVRCRLEHVGLLSFEGYLDFLVLRGKGQAEQEDAAGEGSLLVTLERTLAPIKEDLPGKVTIQYIPRVALRRGDLICLPDTMFVLA